MLPSWPLASSSHAASGVVSLARDGMPDRNTSWDVGGGFGNHVVVTHTDGARSIYVHLRRNSIEVSLGTQVEPGTVLGLVGSSGRSNWPHLHFEVQRDGDVLDPFAGECGANESLWLEQLPYQDEFLVTDAGITNLAPSTFAVLLERPPTLSRFPLDVESFRFWIQLANQSDARVRMELREPGGETWTFADGRCRPPSACGI